MRKSRKSDEKTKYFLVAFGDFSGKKELLTQILMQFQPILASNFLKFNFGDDYILAHFETNEKHRDVIEFCDIILSGTLKNYMVIPHNKDVFISFPTNFKDFLLDLDSNTKFENDIMSVDDFTDEDEEIMEQILSAMLHQKEIEPKISLNELLEKVHTKGLKNLTKKEKNILYEYSKRV
jgi:hypothetical protein